MSMNDLEAALRLIDDNPAIGDFVGPRSEKLVSAAETALSVTFPATYRKFLRRLGCGAVRGSEFYGVVHEHFEHSAIPDAIWLTLRDRKTGNLPSSFVIVGHTGDGGCYVIDLSQRAADGESPVVEWWPGLPEGSEDRRTVATDFGEFLLEHVREAMDQ